MMYSHLVNKLFGGGGGWRVDLDEYWPINCNLIRVLGHS